MCGKENVKYSVWGNNKINTFGYSLSDRHFLSTLCVLSYLGLITTYDIGCIISPFLNQETEGIAVRGKGLVHDYTANWWIQNWKPTT